MTARWRCGRIIAEGAFNRGNALHGLERFDEPLASYDRALAAAAGLCRGALQSRQRAARAEAISTRRWRATTARLPQRPDYAEALSNRGNALHELKRFDEALASYDARSRCSRTMPRPSSIAANLLH